MEPSTPRYAATRIRGEAARFVGRFDWVGVNAVGRVRSFNGSNLRFGNLLQEQFIGNVAMRQQEAYVRLGWALMRPPLALASWASFHQWFRA